MKLSYRYQRVAGTTSMADGDWVCVAILGGAVVATSGPMGTQTGARCDVMAQLEEMGILTDGVNASLGSDVRTVGGVR